MIVNYHVFVVPGSHFDLGWCATIGECLSWGDEIIKRAIEIIQEEPTYKFTIDYTLFLKHFLETYPNYKDMVKEFLLEGKLQISSTMVGAMEQILDGEILIREIVNAKRWIREELGIDVKTVQHSDLPGHTIQLPQILQKAGIENISYSRFHPPIPLHWWEAPDGSKVLACNNVHGYGWGFLLDEERGGELLIEQLKELTFIWPSKNVLMVQESDLLLPEPRIVGRVAMLNEELQNIKLKISTLDEFYAAVRKEKVILPVYKGEAPYGFYSLPATQPLTYKEARIGENKLTSAEKIASLREILGLGTYPGERIEHAWENLFYCHDHNISGRRGDLNNEVREKKAVYGRIEGEEILREAILSVGVNIKYSQIGEPIVIFNTLNWKRNDVVQAYMEFPGEWIKGVIIKDQEGQEVPVQILKAERARDERVDFSNTNLSRVDFLLLAKDIPPTGYKTFYVYPTVEIFETNNDIKVEPNFVENPFYRIEFSNKNKIKLWWKVKEKELSNDGFGDVVVIEDLRWDLEDALEEQAQKEGVPKIVREELDYEPDEYYKKGEVKFTGMQWSLLREKVEVIESGPLRTIVRFEGKVLNSSVIEDIILYRHIPRIDFKVTINWEGKKNTQVRVRFPFNVLDGKINYEVPFCAVELNKDEMPNTYRGIGGRFVQKWIDISNENFGVTFGTQNCAHILSNTTIEPIIIRSTYSCGDPFAWSLNEGFYVFNFSVMAHDKDWKESRSYRLGWEFNNPLEYFQMNVVEPIKPLKPELPEKFSLFEIDNPSIVITTVKKSFSNDDMWALRFFDAEGKGGEVNITFSPELDEAWISNLIEKPIEKIPVRNNKIHVNLEPSEIATILLKFKKEVR